MKRAIIIGATSGIGEEVAKLLIQQGWHIGIAGRREEALEKLQATAPGQIEIQRLDVTDAKAPTLLETLIRKLGGMDLFFLSSGIGSQNPDLKPEIELNTARTNVEGFTRMMTTSRPKEVGTSLSSVPLQAPKDWASPRPIPQRNASRILTSKPWHNSPGCNT